MSDISAHQESPIIRCWTTAELLSELAILGSPWVIRGCAAVAEAELDARPDEPDEPDVAPLVRIGIGAARHAADCGPGAPGALAPWLGVVPELATVDGGWWVSLLAPDEWVYPFLAQKLRATASSLGRWIPRETVRCILGDVYGEAIGEARRKVREWRWGSDGGSEA